MSNLIYHNGKPIFKGDPLDTTSFLQDMEDYLFDSFKDVVEEKGSKVMLLSKGEVTTYLSINCYISAEKVLQPIWEMKLRPKLCKHIVDYRLGAATLTHCLAKVHTVLSHCLQAHCFFALLTHCVVSLSLAHQQSQSQNNSSKMQCTSDRSFVMPEKAAGLDPRDELILSLTKMNCNQSETIKFQACNLFGWTEQQSDLV